MFTVEDHNKPMLFITNCTGCILAPQKHDQVIIITSSGEHIPVGMQMPHELSMLLYNKIIETSKRNGAIEIPDMSQMDDDDLREILPHIEVRDE